MSDISPPGCIMGAAVIGLIISILGMFFFVDGYFLKQGRRNSWLLSPGDFLVFWHRGIIFRRKGGLNTAIFISLCSIPSTILIGIGSLILGVYWLSILFFSQSILYIGMFYYLHHYEKYLKKKEREKDTD